MKKTAVLKMVRKTTARIVVFRSTVRVMRGKRITEIERYTLLR